MGLKMRERHRLTEEIAQRYRTASPEKKRGILDEFIATTGYNRKYASHLLSRWGLSKYVRMGDELLKLTAGRPRKKVPRIGRPHYPHSLDSILELLWVLHNSPCGKRLAPALRENRDALLQSAELGISPADYDAIASMSPATIDRRLRGKHPEQSLKGITHTRPAKALKNLVPVRTWGDWQEALPGEFQADTVGHDGGISSGEFCFTLTAVDVASGWTELRALRNRASRWIEAALEDIRGNLPFSFLGLHTDNGGEFINLGIAAFCARNAISFTRSRADRKNDNCYVECRNDDAVRRSVGYARLDTDEELQALAQVYRFAVPLMNYFLPSMRLVSKRREGAKVIKRHDRAKTPYLRLMDSPLVSPEVKDHLEERRGELDLVRLKLAYDDAIDRLAAFNKNKTVPAACAEAPVGALPG
jgi:hypothetical protein